MGTFRAHYDGQFIVPDDPIDLPAGAKLEVRLVEAAVPPLARLAEKILQLPDNEDTPTDLAAQHDHYLYGTPKRQ